jgi:polyhydroxyalkanoate synthesis regulator phasin
MNLHEQIYRIKSIMGIIQEGEEHIKNLYKSWANKKSGNPEEAMKIMDDVIVNRKNLPKKDFSNYNSYEELFQDLNQIKKPKLDEDITEFYRGDIKNGDDLLVFAANTWESSCKYGAGSKWCTTSRTNSSDWNRHNNTGTEFFWVFRNKPQDDPNHKFSFHMNHQ